MEDENGNQLFWQSGDDWLTYDEYEQRTGIQAPRETGQPHPHGSDDKSIDQAHLDIIGRLPTDEEREEARDESNADLRDRLQGSADKIRSIELNKEAVEIARGLSEQQRTLAEHNIGILESIQGISDERWELYKSHVLPLEKDLSDEALVGRDAAYESNRAGMDVNKEFDLARDEYARNLGRYGVDANDPKFAGLENEFALAEVAAESGARTNTRLAIHESNKARRSAVLGFGRGTPMETSQMLSTAAGLNSGASATLGRGASAYQGGVSGLSNLYAGIGANQSGLNTSNLIFNQNLQHFDRQSTANAVGIFAEGLGVSIGKGLGSTAGGGGEG